jgi:hypothetical protein
MMRWLVPRTLLAAAAYGYALGAAHDHLYATRNLLKFPLLIASTAGICALSYWFVALALGARLRFLAVQGAAWGLFTDTCAMLASASPVVLFLALVMRGSDDGHVGEYDMFLSTNVALIAVAGTLALVRRANALLPLTGRGLRRRVAVVVAWLSLTLFVGGQVAFLMRPLFGLPATRGGTPPWFLWNEPDLRGATNFYVALWQTVQRRQLPALAERR